MTAVEYRPLDPAVLADPYPVYEALRESSPVHHVRELDLWAISRYDDVVGVLRDPGRYSSRLGMGRLMRGGLVPGRGRPPVFSMDLASLRVLIATDPPDHTTLRRLVGKVFTPREVAALEPRIRQLAEAMVDELIEHGPGADVASLLSVPLPVTVIAELLAIPPERRDDFKRWSDDMVGGLSGSWDETRAQSSAQEMFQFFMDVAAERTARPGSDLISLLVTRGKDGEAELSIWEVVVFCILLLIAGNETTTNLIGNFVAAMFDHPAQAGRLWADPGLASSAVEETLRYDAPVQGLFRATTEEISIGTTAVPAGAVVMPLFASGNRDEHRYRDAAMFVVDRNPQDHLAFGNGIHLCVGAPLARLEARVVVETLVARLRALEPAGPAERVESMILRGFSYLPVTALPR